MLQQHWIFLLGLALFSAAGARLIYIRAIASPQFIATLTFLVMGFLALIPQLSYSADREYVLSVKTQIFVLAAAASFLTSVFFMRRPALLPRYPAIRWKYLPLKGWLGLYFLICLSDPILSYLLYGKVGLVQGNEGMGSGGGAHSEVFTSLTFFAWSAASMAMAMVMSDFLFSFTDILPYLRRRFVEVLLVLGCLLCTALSGNRFVLICQLLSLILGFGLFSRLRVWMLAAVAVFLGMFFVLIGNFRFGAVNITDSLEYATGIDSIDMPYAWVTTYLEPNFPNLDNFLRAQPSMRWGVDWLTSVIPSALVDGLGLTRANSAQWMVDKELYSYRGLTFRTMYPDLVMDFGVVGALLLGAGFFLLGARIYRRALVSHVNFLVFLAYSPLLLFTPLLTGFYQLSNLIPFALLWLVDSPRRRARLVPEIRQLPKLEQRSA